MKSISEFETILKAFDFTYILSIIMAIIPAFLCITLHEISHGLAACVLGDDTAKNAGRLSLNPLKHLDVMGFLMMLVFRVGWAKPVPVNMYKFKNPKTGMAITALAGPLSNLLISVVFLFLFGFFYFPLAGSSVGSYFLEMIKLTAYMSVGLAVFNFIPFPPLDGSKILFSFLNDEAYDKLMRYEKYGAIIMIALVASGVLSKYLSLAIGQLYTWLTVFADWGMKLAILVM